MPSELSHADCMHIIAALDRKQKLQASLLYGCGLRVEVDMIRLRLKDVRLADASPAFAERFDALPWGMFDPVSTDPRPGYISPLPQPAWRKLDDSRATIYRGGADGLRPLWERGRMTEKTPVMVAASCAIPLAMLQLLARLPRAEVRMGTGDFLAIRFAGGEAIIPGRWRHAAPDARPAPKFSLFLSADQREQLHGRW